MKSCYPFMRISEWKPCFEGTLVLSKHGRHFGLVSGIRDGHPTAILGKPLGKKKFEMLPIDRWNWYSTGCGQDMENWQNITEDRYLHLWDVCKFVNLRNKE